MRVLFFAALALAAAPAAGSAQVCLYGGPDSSSACGPQYSSDREEVRQDRDEYYAPATSRERPARPVTADEDATLPARFVNPRLVPNRYGPDDRYEGGSYGEPDMGYDASYADSRPYEPLPTYGQDREPRLAGGPPPARFASAPPREYDPYLPAPRYERDYAERGYYGRDYEEPEHRKAKYRERGHYGYDREDYRERRHARGREVDERREYGYFYEAPRYEARREYRLYRGGDYRYAPQRIYGRTLNPAAWGARVRQPARWRDHDGYYFEESCYDRDPRGGWDHCESLRLPDVYPERLSYYDAAPTGGVGAGDAPRYAYGGGNRVIFVEKDSRFGGSARAHSFAFADASARARTQVRVHRGGKGGHRLK